MKRFFIAPLLFLLAACDALGPADSFEGVVFRTTGVDGARGVVELPNGDLMVYGGAEGVGAPTDGNLYLPFMLRLHSDGSPADTVIYRDLGYAQVIGVAPWHDALAVMVNTTEHDGAAYGDWGVTLFRTGDDGTRQSVLYTEENRSAAYHPVLPTADGGLLLTLFPSSVGAEHVIKLDASGAVAWRYTMPDVQDIRYVAEDAEGDLFMLGVYGRGGYEVARLGTEGEERWRRTFPADSVGQVDGFTVVGDGTAVLETSGRYPDRRLVVRRLNGQGGEEWAREYGVGKLWGRTLAGLPDGGLVLGWNWDDTENIGGNRVEIARLGPAGDVLWQEPFGPERGTTNVTQILPLRDGRIVAAGATGPEHISGYGGDDFDVLVAFYDGG